MKKSILILITLISLINFVYAAAPDASWQFCRDLTIENSDNIDKGNQSILTNITGLTIVKDAINETRIANAGCNNGGMFVNHTVADTDNSTWALIAFITGATHSADSNLTYSIYYNTTSPANPNYETKLTVYDEFDGSTLSGHKPDYTFCGTTWSAGGFSISGGEFILDGLDNPAELNVSNCVSSNTHRALILDGGYHTTSDKSKSFGWDPTDSTSGNDFAQDAIYRMTNDLNNIFLHNDTSQAAFQIVLNNKMSHTVRLHPGNTTSASVYNDTKIYHSNAGLASASYTTFHQAIANGGSNVPNGGRIEKMIIWNGSGAEWVTGYYPQSTIMIGSEQQLCGGGLVCSNESEGDDALTWGIGNSSISGATITSDQQVYVRKLNGSQASGRFDKFAISGDQRWGFNYVTTNDPTSDLTNVFNITPTLYVLELQAKTQAQIRDEISLFINNTKT